MQFPSWKEIPWRKIEKKVDKFQRKIFRLSSQGKTVSFHKTQELLVNSHYAKLLAVRRVTQDNSLSRKHPTRGLKWIYKQYFSKIGGYKWTFVGKYKGEVSISLKRYSSIKIVRHIKVAGSKTPYDGDYVYWVRRRGKAIGAPPVLGKLLKKQEGKCSLC